MFALIALLVSCAEETNQVADAEIVNRQQEIYSKSSPVPMFDSSLERERIVQLYQARMAATQTWSVWRSNTGMIEGDCPSSGYPIPFGVQLTASESDQVIVRKGYTGYHTEVLPQAEPNGLFTNDVTSDATWVFCVVDGTIVPAYVEGLVTAYAMPVVVDYSTNRVTPLAGGTPTVTLKR